MNWDEYGLTRREAFSLALPDIAFVIDENGRLLDVLADEHSGSSLYDDLSTVLDRTVHQVFGDDGADEHLSVVRTAIETGQPRTHEYQLDTGEGTRWFEARVEPLPYRIDRPGAVIWAAREVTDRKRHEQQSDEVTLQLEAINRVVRHDIHNDASIVLEWAELLDEYVDEAGREHLRKVHNSAEHILELTEGAREYVEMLTTDGEIEPTPAPLRSMLHTEVALGQEAFPEATFVLTEAVPDIDVTANEMLGVVFRNLLVNAVQHNDGDEPVVEVSCEVREEDALVRIADDGPGIPDDRKDSIFGTGDTGPEKPGTGFGLYLVHALVSQYGGIVRVEDNDPEGAVFTVRLPRAG